MHDLGPGRLIKGDGVDGTGMHTPRFVALRAGVRDKPALIMERKHFYAGFCRIEGVFVVVRTRQFALQTSGALIRVNVQ